MEWVRQRPSQDGTDDGRRDPPTRLGAAPKPVPSESRFPGDADFDKTRSEDRYDSGLDSFVSSADGPDCGPTPHDRSWSSGAKPDAADGDRLDSAIGDSIDDDAVSSLSERIGTAVIHDDPDHHRDQVYDALGFISEDGDTMLHLALIHEQWGLFQQLLQIVELNPAWTAYLDIQNDLGQSALHLAVIVGGGESVRSLLGAGASVEVQERAGNTAVHLAVFEGKHECVRAITASPRTLPRHLDIYNYKGIGALHSAVQRGSLGTIATLLEGGANVNLKDQSSGRSPLHWAVEYQNAAAVELLVTWGADVDQSSYAGHTPLYCALYRPGERLRSLLRAAGASEGPGERDEDERDSDQDEFDDLIINGQRVL